MTEDKTAPERLNRFLARSGVGSRRRADELIAAGHVTVNGAVVTNLATRVRAGIDAVALDGKPMAAPGADDLWIVLNKPRDTLTTRRDVRGRRTVFDLLPKSHSNLITVGRLDFDTEGVLLLTSDGHAANRLMHPRYEVKRVYEAVVSGTPSMSDLARLRRGLDLGDKTPARAQSQVIRKARERTTLRLSLREGRKREIKRMMEAIGCTVVHLRRISYAGITARGLKAGEWRQLSRTEVASLLSSVLGGESA